MNTKKTKSIEQLLNEKDPLVPFESLIKIRSKGRHNETENDLKIKQ